MELDCRTGENLAPSTLWASGLRAVVAASAVWASAVAAGPQVGSEYTVANSELKVPSEAHLKLAVVADHIEAVAGRTLTLAMKVSLDAGWYTYWRGYSDSGSPLQFRIQLSGPLASRVEVGAVIWPAPSRHTAEGGIVDHIYESSATFLVPLKVVGTEVASGTVEVVVVANYLVCKDVCLPGKAEASTRFELGPTTKLNPAAEAAITEAKTRRIEPLNDQSPVVAAFVDGVLRIAPPAATQPGEVITAMRFFPGTGIEPTDILAQGEWLAVPGGSSKPSLSVQLNPDADKAVRVPSGSGNRVSLGVVEVTRSVTENLKAADQSKTRNESELGSVSWFEVAFPLDGK